MRGPRSVTVLTPSTNTGAAGASPVPGSEMPIFGVLALARPVDDAAHHRDVQPLDARIDRAPFRHGLREIGLDVARQLLEHGRGRAPAAGTGGDLRRKTAEPHGLQQFLRDLHFLRPVAARLGGERNADRVAKPFLQQDAERGGGSDDALRAHAGFGQAEMQRVIGALAQACDRR